MNPSSSLVVLYTGGTIGMVQGPQGLEPAAGFERQIREAQSSRADCAGLPDWRFQELLPPLDSANMQQRDWLAMRDSIVDVVEAGGCRGVLLLHGTDTLAYTAAALSFLLLGLPVPVIVSGSMLPAAAEGSDAWDNLFGALSLLHTGIARTEWVAPEVPGVHVFFAGRLLPGTRSSKRHSEAFAAFDAAPRLAASGLPQPLAAGLDYRCRRSPVELAVMPLYPGLSATQVAALVGTGVRGLVLECYGSGTGPVDNQAWFQALRDAHAQGVVLLAISQCPVGRVVFETYAAGSRLQQAGVISGAGMTREAALGKLFALLGAGLEPLQVEHWLTRNLCGEAVS